MFVSQTAREGQTRPATTRQDQGWSGVARHDFASLGPVPPPYSLRSHAAMLFAHTPTRCRRIIIKTMVMLFVEK